MTRKNDDDSCNDIPRPCSSEQTICEKRYKRFQWFDELTRTERTTTTVPKDCKSLKLAASRYCRIRSSDKPSTATSDLTGMKKIHNSHPRTRLFGSRKLKQYNVRPGGVKRTNIFFFFLDGSFFYDSTTFDVFAPR